MTRWTRIRVAPLLGVLAVAVGAPADASGQSLHLAELFAEQGRMGDARAEVLAWFEIRGAEATPEELQHGLFLRGRLSDDPAAGMRDLERLVEEHPEGPFTARALTWMGAFRADRGEMQNAAALYQRVVREHPEAESAVAARAWLAAQGIAVPDPEPAARRPAAAAPVTTDSVLPAPADRAPPVTAPPAEPRPADTAAAAVSDSVKAPALPADTAAAAVLDSLPPTASPADTAAVFVPYSAPTPPAVTAADTTPPPPVTAADTTTPPPVIDTTPAPRRPAADSAATPVSPPVSEVPRPRPTEASPPAAPPVERIPHGPPVPGAAAGGVWAVQIGAFRNAEGARGLVAELVEAGFDARLVQVPLNDLLRVRVGRFEALDGASAVLERIREAGYDGAVVNDARAETVVR